MTTPQIREIVRVDITRETLPLSQSAFSTLLIAGDSDKLPAADVIVLTTDADLIASNVYSLKLNGELISETYATSNDATMDALAAQIQAKASVVTAVATGSPKRIITITSAGDETAPIYVTEAQVTGGASQAGVTTVRTPAVRTKTYTTLAEVAVDFATTDPEYIAASIFFDQNPHPSSLKIGRIVNGNDWSDELTLVSSADDAWYFLAVTTKTVADVKDVAAWANAKTKIFFTSSDDVNILDSGVSSDIAAFFENLAYDRVVTVFNELAGNTYPEVAWISALATKVPGAATWNFKTLESVTPSDTLTDAQRTTLLDTKNANGYFTVGGQSIMREGKVANGEFIDLVHGTDYLESQMTDAIFAVLANADKVPYTDQGIASVEGAIRASLDDAITEEFLAARPDLYEGQPYNVTIPKVADISQTDRANRILPDITFRATLAGAIHEVEVQGTVAV
jgi:hypothetical protein